MTGTADPTPCRIVVLLSGSGTNLQAIIDRFHDNPAVAVTAVISNRADAAGLGRAVKAGIPTAVLGHQEYEGRDGFDQALMARIDEYQPDLVVLAGFMRIFTSAFVAHYEGRLLNIHPSLLPRHRGLKTHQRVLEAGDMEHGATVHFVTAELDGGPAIVQARIAITAGDTVEQLAKRVLAREHEIYPLAIEWFCEGRLTWRDRGPWFDGQPLREPRLVPDDHFNQKSSKAEKK